jgi:hypothetical protein
MTVIFSARDELAARSVPNKGYNLLVLTGQARSEQVLEQLDRQSAEAVHVRYRVPLQSARLVFPDDAASQDVPFQEIDVVELEGRADGDIAWDLDLIGPAWGTVPDGAYLPANKMPDGIRDRISEGSTVTVITGGGAQRDLAVAGFYSPKDMGDLIDRDLASPTDGILVSKASALELGGPQTPVSFLSRMPERRLRDVTEKLGRALPDDIIVSLADLNDVFQRLWRNLLVFVVSIAGLALVAGAVLIANAVGLAMVERRREVGILKAVGFSSGDVLRTFLLENGILGLLAGVMGTLGVVVAVEVLNAVEPKAGLAFQLLPGLVVMTLSVVIALASAALVAWRPTLARPLVVLRDE